MADCERLRTRLSRVGCNGETGEAKEVPVWGVSKPDLGELTIAAAFDAKKDEFVLLRGGLPDRFDDFDLGLPMIESSYLGRLVTAPTTSFRKSSGIRVVRRAAKDF
jgi:hypothetical protein